MCECKFSWILCSTIFDILNSLWLSVMLSQVFISFAEILLSTHQFGFSFQGFNIHNEFMLLIFIQDVFPFFWPFPLYSWLSPLGPGLNSSANLYLFSCLLSLITENVTLSWRILPLSNSVPHQVWSQDLGMKHAACFPMFYQCLRCDMHMFCFKHLIWLSEGAVFWLISLPLEAQYPGSLNRRK